MSKTREIIYILAIVVMGLLGAYMWNNNNNLNERFDRYEQTITALNDSIHKGFEDGKTVWSKQAPEIDINDLVNSAYFKTLSAEQQAYYNELSKIKGLIASSQAELQRQGSILETLETNPGRMVGDSILFAKGTELAFAEADTSKNLQWKSTIKLDSSIVFAFDYDYKFNIQTTYERQKDKSILVKYKIDDPDLKLNSMQNYIIPTEQAKTKFGRWFQKNKKPILMTAGGLIFVGGGVVGYGLAK
jgi:hypothetical protein